jgi:hypothetical protein
MGLLQSDLGGHLHLSSAPSVLFLTLFLLFARFLPMIAMSEVKGRGFRMKNIPFAGQAEGSISHR